jgi:hypothetical protein
MSSTSPRPILKRTSSSAHPASAVLSSSSSYHPSNCDRDRTRYAVHFPPSPTLTRTFSVYSSTTYDRSPIVVGPNTCALPERGCPGRTYTLEEDSSHRGDQRKRSSAKGRHAHPRSMGGSLGLGQLSGDEPREVDQHPQNIPPPLIPDLSSSESDDSDSLLSFTSQYMYIPNSSSTPVQDPFDGRCATPTPFSYSRDVSRQRRRVRSPSRTRRSSCSDRHDSDDERDTTRSTWNNYKNLSEKSPNSSILAVPDEGCFGGF